MKIMTIIKAVLHKLIRCLFRHAFMLVILLALVSGLLLAVPTLTKVNAPHTQQFSVAEQYALAMQNYDSFTIYRLFNSQVLKENGVSEEQIKQGMERNRELKREIKAHQDIGEFKEGEYWIQVSVIRQSDETGEYWQFYVFHLDHEGRIIKIE